MSSGPTRVSVTTTLEAPLCEEHGIAKVLHGRGEHRQWRCLLCRAEKNERWRQAHPEKFKEAQRRYRTSEKGRKRLNATQSAYRKNNRERVNVWRRKAVKKRRHETRGRVCVSCHVTDAEVLWSQNKSYCGTCHRRRLRNGACGTCRAALRRGLLGNKGKPTCPRCPAWPSEALDRVAAEVLARRGGAT